MQQHVLAVFPHPDDETFGCGGTLALFTQAGIPVTYVCGTLGEMGRNMGRPLFATRESLPKIREAELEEACRALGIRSLIKLGLRDKTIEFEDPEPLIRKLEQILRTLKPTIVLTHYSGYAVHPDHNALGDLTMRALQRLSAEERPQVYAHAFARDCREILGPPDIIKDISAVAEIKLAAIRAHKSQSQLLLPRDSDGTVKELTLDSMSHTLKQESFWTYHFTS